MTNPNTKTWQFNFQGVGTVREAVENIKEFHRAKKYPWPLPYDGTFIDKCEGLVLKGGAWLLTYTQYKILKLELLE